MNEHPAVSSKHKDGDGILVSLSASSSNEKRDRSSSTNENRDRSSSTKENRDRSNSTNEILLSTTLGTHSSNENLSTANQRLNSYEELNKDTALNYFSTTDTQGTRSPKNVQKASTRCSNFWDEILREHPFNLKEG